MTEHDDLDQPSDCPVIGTIVMWGSDTPPTEWVFCNGASLSPADYPQTIGAAAAAFHTSSDGTVRVPDLRGYFVRGVDDRESGTKYGDPDAAARMDMFDENMSAPNKPYSTQKSAFALHDHDCQDFPVSTKSEIVSELFDDDVGASLLSASTTVQEGGATESRPINMYLRYIIRVGTSKPSPRAVSDTTALGIIALWGWDGATAGLAHLQWRHVCDARDTGLRKSRGIALRQLRQARIGQA